MRPKGFATRLSAHRVKPTPRPPDTVPAPVGTSASMLLNSLLVALVTALVAVPLLMRCARHVGLVDLPDARKQHKGAVPLVGGVAIFFAAGLALVASGSIGVVPFGFIAAAAAILLLGILDDASDLSPLVRFGVQAGAVAFAILTADHALPDLGHFLGGSAIPLGVLAVPMTVFGMLGVVNSMNLVDGADGLAGGIAATALFWLLVAFSLLGSAGSHPVGAYASPVLGAVLGGVLGFLYYNLRRRARRRAKVFLGDAGSLLLGFVLAWFAVGATVEPGRSDMPPAAVLWLFWVPLYDTVGVMVRRILAGRSPMSPDREHLHHLFQDLGFTPRETVNRLILINLLGGAIGIAGWQFAVPDIVMLTVYVLGFGIYVSICAWVWRKLKTPLRSTRHQSARPAPQTATEDEESPVTVR